MYIHITRVKQTSERRSLATTRIIETLDTYYTLTHTPHPGLTYILFWIQMVTGALVSAQRAAALKDFGAFVEGAVEIAWEGLWRLYYSEGVMESAEAKGMFVPPDVRKLPSYIV
ncbi:hypothetical protein HK104_007698 [Borealophlyctis nickersoniae]|nr:hypothetical protein HK104_007698 [Borealophlyctis nickersoniae]